MLEIRGQVKIGKAIAELDQGNQQKIGKLTQQSVIGHG
jgi:hypothetical protein